MGNALDENFNRKPRVIQDYFFRKDFPKPMALLGYILFGAGLLAMLGESYIVGPFLFLVGGFFGFTFSGIQLDIANREAKHYTAIFWIKKGSWTNLKSYPYISILHSRTSYRANNFNASQMTFSDESYDIYLLSKDHRDRFLLKSEANESTARLSAKLLGQQLGVEYVNFHPVAKSRATRR